jgi:two-component sensor histidine kinase
MAKMADTTLMVCTQGGLLQYKNGTFKPLPLTYASASARTGIATEATDSWCRDARGRTWLVMREKKLYLLDRNLLKDVSHLAPSRPGYYWRIAFNNCNNKVYLCTDTLLYGDERGLYTFKNAGNGQCIIKPRAIHTFTNGKLLIYAAGNKFLLVDTGNHVQDVSAAIGIKVSNPELSFCNEASGKFYIAYNGGICKFHWNNRQLPVKEWQITRQQGLPNDAVHSITIDNYNRLWAITSAGLVLTETNPKGNPVVHRFSEEAGIISNEWLQSRLLTDAAGYIWMNFANSLYRFDPRSIQFNNMPPAVTIEDIQLNPQPAQWNAFTDSLFGYRQLPHRIELPHDLNNLSISYRAPCFSGVSGLEYSYLLAGTDTHWSAATKSNSVSFVKLPPGTYVFKVRARKSNTAWSEPTLFTFIIKKPYWESWWFQLAVITMATITLALLFRNRVQHIRRKAQIGEQLRELELKALRAQMNPHFIYNALNSIQALVLNNQTDKASLYISKFGRLLRQVLNHSEQSSISLTEELHALELYIQLEQLRLNVPLQYHIRPDTSINTDEEEIPPLVLQPIVENALWHGLSRKQGEKTLDIALRSGNEWLIVEITDNGIGRQQAASQKTTNSHTTSKGMEITGRRIKEYNRLRGISAIDIIDLYDDAQQPAGTKVILHIKRKRPDT